MDSTPAVTYELEVCPDMPYLPPNPSLLLVWGQKQTQAHLVVSEIIVYTKDYSFLAL